MSMHMKIEKWNIFIMLSGVDCHFSFAWMMHKYYNEIAAAGILYFFFPKLIRGDIIISVFYYISFEFLPLTVKLVDVQMINYFKQLKIVLFNNWIASQIVQHTISLSVKYFLNCYFICITLINKNRICLSQTFFFLNLACTTLWLCV